MSCRFCSLQSSCALATPQGDAPHGAVPLRWFMVGTPNTGKTSLINAISGSSLEVGNWSGTTLDLAHARANLACGEVELVDLPGAYTLAGSAPDEEILLPALLADPSALVVNVVDATNLTRDLTLTLELAELGVPMVVALNLVDQAEKQGIAIDVKDLEANLGVPVVIVKANVGRGIGELVTAASRAGVGAAKVPYPQELEQAIGRLLPLTESRWHAIAALTGELDADAMMHANALQPAAIGHGSDTVATLPPVGPQDGVSLPTVPNLAARAEAERGSLLASGLDPFLDVSEARHRLAHAFSGGATRPLHAADSAGDRVDRLILHPVVGPFALLGGLALTFHLTFALSSPWVDFLGVVQGVLAGWAEALPLPGLLSGFLAGAVIEGVGTVIAFVPVLFTLYALLGFLENAGLLARVAYLADGLMRRLGLPGRAVLPMVLSLGCTVPAVQATKMLEQPRDRLRVALAIPSIPCGARLPVFVLLAAAFVPQYAGLVLTGLYVAGFLATLLTALLFRGALKGETATGVMELPAYRLPPFSLVFRLAWIRTKAFLTSAGGPILAVVAVVWALLAFNLPNGVSVFEFVARGMAPLFAPIGLEDWRVVGALIPGTIAKEVMIGSMALTFATGAEASSALGFMAGLQDVFIGFWDAIRGTLTGLWGSVLATDAPDGALGSRLAGTLSLASALSLMVFSLLYVPCMATLAAISKAFGRRYALLSAGYQLGLAYLAGFLVYQLFR